MTETTPDPYDQQEETMHAVADDAERAVFDAETPPRTRPGKMTAERLAKVERLQADLRACATQAAALSLEEENGWQPGTPQQARTHRVDPLEAMARGLADHADQLEDLYA